MAKLELPWLIMGDLNCTCSSSEDTGDVLSITILIRLKISRISLPVILC